MGTCRVPAWRPLVVVLIATAATLVISERSDSQLPWLLMYPPSRSHIYVNKKHTVFYSPNAWPAALSANLSQQAKSSFYIGVHFKAYNRRLETEVYLSGGPEQENAYTEYVNQSYAMVMPLTNTPHGLVQGYEQNITTMNSFIVSINDMGYVDFQLDVIEMFANTSKRLLGTQIYQLAAKRENRMVDTGFNGAILVLGIINMFGLGCRTTVQAVKDGLRKPVAIIVAGGTQYILIPMVVFGLCKLLSVQNNVTLGLLLASCVPGGGLGHLIVAITGDADTELSLALNFFQLLVPLASLPVWFFSFVQLLPTSFGMIDASVYYVILWVLGLTVPYAAGALVRRYNQAAVRALLNWFIKPLLLLAFILFVTLGVYINIYVFHVLNMPALVTGGVVPFIGFLIGGGLTLITKQGKSAAKTVATEAAIMNSVIVIASMRFSMQQPDADIASAPVLWVFLITPVPFILMFLFHRVKRKIVAYFDKKEFEKEQTQTILQSFSTIRNNALQISGITKEQRSDRKEEVLVSEQTLLLASGHLHLEVNETQKMQV